jgi:hypothetical protein
LHGKGIFSLDLPSIDSGLVGEEEGDEETAYQAAWAAKQRRSSGAGDGATAQSPAEMRSGRR